MIDAVNYIVYVRHLRISNDSLNKESTNKKGL